MVNTVAIVKHRIPIADNNVSAMSDFTIGHSTT
jgi:hypothetical protein